MGLARNVENSDLMIKDTIRTIGQVTEIVKETWRSQGDHLLAKRVAQAMPKVGKRLRKKTTSSPARNYGHEDLIQAPWYMRFAGYFCHFMLFAVGFFRESIWGHGPINSELKICEKNRDGYSPMYIGFEGFYIRNVFRRLAHCFRTPIASAPGGEVDVLEHYSENAGWTFNINQNHMKTCINFGSYNYLGYAQTSGPCTAAAIQSIQTSGLTSSSARQELGTLSYHRQLETTVSEFLGKEDAITFGMGFATNVLNIPRLMDKRTLVISDEKNHASLILGLRLSGATVRVFQHNNPEHLERVLRKAMLHGQPRTRRPFKKVFIVVEGVYSMEGTIVRLPEIMAIKKKYKAYLYLDEAHSVGAMGPNGRGVVDYYGLNPKDIDIMMGTFTKSFGSAGGYIAGSKRLIDHLRANSQANTYPTSMSAPVANQIIEAMKQIMDKDHGDGMERVRVLARNSKYIRRRLKQLGLVVYGHDDSPVVPVMLFVTTKISYLLGEMKKKGIALVGVGYPATKISHERSRLCVSSSHSKEMLDYCVNAFDEIADKMNIRYNRGAHLDMSEVQY
ncbi:hypothetical protein TCAL_03900 [Tigriopus californicus]|uniref:serine C-palmitoyltransferase n=1 Tax=Tigriopus californicus TaxID=6832 RepID=A0A553NF53_TIGCA|nr:serine palmitoyltransferase 2-like [Tigriopus californicus]TRY64077.1 hypothetical protein TCAL_03900 [Tigriopus californicus]|eukprot:TCALIF_03900-PA protein Name:"Similar to SPTLC2 Serine palmitoyltransferase 2 (Cricetulus griseus)" AED:0.02 eAED:0.02 QI:0/-1/0/1/-1/1/1/0/560